MRSLKERLIEYIEYKGISKRAFLLSCGFSGSYLNNISKGISYDAIDKIKTQYPELSMPWLVLEEGKMLVANNEKDEVVPVSKYVEVLEENRRLQNENRRLIAEIEGLKGKKTA